MAERADWGADLLAPNLDREDSQEVATEAFTDDMGAGWTSPRGQRFALPTEAPEAFAMWALVVGAIVGLVILRRAFRGAVV
jgi:hypothetical protein